MKLNDTIVALATPAGAGAISVIRVSGPEAIKIIAPLFVAKSKKQNAGAVLIRGLYPQNGVNIMKKLTS